MMRIIRKNQSDEKITELKKSYARLPYLATTLKWALLSLGKGADLTTPNISIKLLP